MQIIQSFWSKPCFHEEQEYVNSRITGGWMKYQYFIFSHCFSCLTIKRHHRHIDFYTDDEGYDLFIKELKLPYDHVSLLLNKIEKENSKLWVLGKLLTIKDQHEPFIHIDNDIYLWEKLPESNSKDFLIAQSNYKIPLMHTHSLKEILRKFDYIPSYIKEAPTDKTKNTNIGVLGGNNMAFFQEYCNTAYKLLERNKSCLHDIDIGPFNQVLDEYLFTSMVRKKGLKICYVIEDSPFDDLESVNAVVRFNLVPVLNKYVHLLGNIKQNIYACEQLELRFEFEFPEYYKKAYSFIKERHGEYPGKEDLNEKRLQRLGKLIPMLYKNDLVQLKKMKIKLAEDAYIRKNRESQQEEEYYLIIKDQATGKESINPLKGTDAILAYFQEPVSIDELLEELKLQDETLKEAEQQKQQFKILDIVTEKIMIDGLLEFV